MRILVTGAGGYIGRHVIDNLVTQEKADVVAVDFNVDGINPKAERRVLDIFDKNTDVYAETGKPDIVLHMAWKDGFVHNSDAHMAYLSAHYLFCKKLLDSGLKHLAVMGSMHEIGYYVGAIDENTPCNPISQYGVAKDALRRSLLVTLNDIKYKDAVFQWLRAYYIYGDDKRNNSIFAKLTIAEEEGKATFPFTTGKNKYDFIHVDELARQLAASVTQNKVNGIINCCSGVPVSLADKVESFIKDHGFKIKLDYGVFPDRAYDSPEVWGDNTKIEEIMKGRL
ncbi:nucleoside-diphosphate sugar epimerase [Spirochaetia bacterium]|nr:nucleoside-diphosphate sugar epimerase [Spirochaetia bacterium]